MSRENHTFPPTGKIRRGKALKNEDILKVLCRLCLKSQFSLSSKEKELQFFKTLTPLIFGIILKVFSSLGNYLVEGFSRFVYIRIFSFFFFKHLQENFP